MFVAACEGFLDKEQSNVLLMRQVALFASQRSSKDFDKYWPMPAYGGKSQNVEAKVWGTKEDADELRQKIEKAHNIKLS